MCFAYEMFLRIFDFVLLWRFRDVEVMLPIGVDIADNDEMLLLIRGQV